MASTVPDQTTAATPSRAQSEPPTPSQPAMGEGIPPAAMAAGMPGGMEGVETHLSRVTADVAGAMASVMCALGGRLGLWRELAAGGPATSDELAVRSGLDERYVREWLLCMASAGYLEVDRTTRQFNLPSGLAMVLAVEGSPFNLAAGFELIAPLVAATPVVAEAFQRSSGVSQREYDQALYAAMEAMSATWLDAMLVSQWVPAVAGLAQRLGEGARVADVGCGGGHALVLLAQAFPQSRFVGYDMFADNLSRARAAAAAAGVSEIVRFEQQDAAVGLRGPFDLVTAFDVLHDAPDVVGLLRSIRRSLSLDGVLLVLEGRSSADPFDNKGPAATILYATSVLYCIPTSLSGGGDGLGTLGLPAERIRDLCGESGFRALRTVPTMGPFNALYELRP